MYIVERDVYLHIKERERDMYILKRDVCLYKRERERKASSPCLDRSQPVPDCPELHWTGLDWTEMQMQKNILV